MSSSCRRHASSPAMTPPLDVDDLLSEILLRLPPQPSSLPRASLVCRRWRQLVSDPRFFRRFRLHHRRNLPLLGVFVGLRAPTFLPTLEAPNRVPPERFSLQLGKDFDYSVCFGCRHGLLLIWVNNTQVLVWDPVTGDQHRIAIPAAFLEKNSIMNGTVLRVAGADQHFQVVLVIADIDEEEHEQALACVYSSKTGSWGNLISTSLPCHAYAEAAVLVGGCLYWHLFLKFPKFKGILEFDLERQSLAVIQLPVDIDALAQGGVFNIMRAEGGGLGFFFLSRSDYTMQLWKRTTDCDGVASWGLAKTIVLDKLLSLKPEEEEKLSLLGFAEEKNVVFLKAPMVVFMINLDSLKFEKLFETNTMDVAYYRAFESVYPAGALVAGGHDVAELLHKMILR